eukprot:4803300-Prymnesium_polylepis.1
MNSHEYPSRIQRSPALVLTAARDGALATQPVAVQYAVGVIDLTTPGTRPDRMPIRRLTVTRTPALPAGSLSALLAPYGGAMRTGAHMSVGSAPNTVGYFQCDK